MNIDKYRVAAFEKLQNITPEQTFDVKDIYKNLKIYILDWTQGRFGQNYRVPTLSTLYPTV